MGIGIIYQVVVKNHFTALMESVAHNLTRMVLF